MNAAYTVAGIKLCQAGFIALCVGDLVEKWIMIQVGLKKDTFTVCIHTLICSKFRDLGETSNSVFVM